MGIDRNESNGKVSMPLCSFAPLPSRRGLHSLTCRAGDENALGGRHRGEREKQRESEGRTEGEEEEKRKMKCSMPTKMGNDSLFTFSPFARSFSFCSPFALCLPLEDETPGSSDAALRAPPHAPSGGGGGSREGREKERERGWRSCNGDEGSNDSDESTSPSSLDNSESDDDSNSRCCCCSPPFFAAPSALLLLRDDGRDSN